MEQNTSREIIRLWQQGRTIEQIQEQLKIVIEVKDESNLNESIVLGNFTIKQVLLG